jgi:hypothetical protein
MATRSFPPPTLLVKRRGLSDDGQLNRLCGGHAELPGGGHRDHMVRLPSVVEARVAAYGRVSGDAQVLASPPITGWPARQASAGRWERQ